MGNTLARSSGNASRANGPLVDVPGCTYNFAGFFISRDNFHLVARAPFARFSESELFKEF